MRFTTLMIANKGENVKTGIVEIEEFLVYGDLQRDRTMPELLPLLQVCHILKVYQMFLGHPSVRSRLFGFFQLLTTAVKSLLYIF